MAEDALKVLKDTKLVLCDAATAAGRNTIIRELLKTNEYYYIISDTTRKPRVNDGVLEENGVVYWFRTEDEMLAELKAGKLVEAELIHKQQVSGMSTREIDKARKQNKIAITDVDRVGVTNVKAAKDDVICLFVIPPDYDTWQKRIEGRGKMDPAEFSRRMETAFLEYQNALSQDYYLFLINDKLDDAVREIRNIVAGKVDSTYQKQARQVAENIFAKLIVYK